MDFCKLQVKFLIWPGFKRQYGSYLAFSRSQRNYKGNHKGNHDSEEVCKVQMIYLTFEFVFSPNIICIVNILEENTLAVYITCRGRCSSYRLFIMFPLLYYIRIFKHVMDNRCCHCTGKCLPTLWRFLTSICKIWHSFNNGPFYSKVIRRRI